VKKKADPKGYYAALNVSPDANPTEIRLAYEMSKQAYKAKGKRPPPKVREAYEVLSDPDQRELYDAGPKSLFGFLKRPDGSSRLDSVPVFIGSLVVLIVVLIFTFGPSIKASFTQYEVGDELYFKGKAKPFGLIEAYEEQHPFADGTRMAAYRVRPATGGEPSWHPASDLHRNTEPR
jgi:curved DNA-binding protein CbpA